MRTISHEEHVLEQYGPRDISWRRATDECLADACQHAYVGRHQEALHSAQDAWVRAHGTMLGIRFRVRSVKTSLYGLHPVAELE